MECLYMYLQCHIKQQHWIAMQVILKTLGAAKGWLNGVTKQCGSLEELSDVEEVYQAAIDNFDAILKERDGGRGHGGM